MIVMIDMDMGNLQSVAHAFKIVGADVLISSKAADVTRADILILPGVGAFGDGMESLKKNSLIEPISNHALSRKKPLIGICVGMQLLADEGEEHGAHRGLGLVPGKVVKLAPTNKQLRIPNMGWCDVTAARASKLFESAGQKNSFYFAHSYYLQCKDTADSAATIDYGGEITVAVERGNIFGMQFHPEKSQDAGLDVLHSLMRQLGAGGR